LVYISEEGFYVNNNPMLYTDPSGNWIETAFDLISLGMTLNDIRNEGMTGMNALMLVTDVVSVVLPIVPAGVSHALRAAKIASKLANTADAAADTIKAVESAKNLVQYGDKAKDAKKWIRNVLDVSVHNADSSHVVLGSYPEYVNYAQKAKTVKPNQGHTYFNMPDPVWNVFKKGDAWKSVNKQFILDQVDQGKRFLGKSSLDKPRGVGLRFELDLLSDLRRNIRWLR
jgi:hypothetical protein